MTETPSMCRADNTLSGACVKLTGFITGARTTPDSSYLEKTHRETTGGVHCG